MGEWADYAKQLAWRSATGGLGEPTDNEWYDPLFRARYGVTSGEKYRRAVTGEIPGAQPIRSEDDVAREERRAAGYLFAKQNPAISAAVQPAVNKIRTSLFGDDPSLVAVANEGQRAALKPPKVAAFNSWDTAASHYFGGKR